MSWTARLLVALLLVLVGAAAATWGLARYQPAARVLGVVPRTEPVPPAQAQQRLTSPRADVSPQAPRAEEIATDARIGELQRRLERVESESEQAQGSAGRADALVIAFAARRALERGVALGYLEPLLVERFGAEHPQAVATIVTASRSPVQLPDLISRYRELEPALVGPPPNEGWWTGFKRELGSLVTIRQSEGPVRQPDARYDRAMAFLTSGEVDSALAETMRLPGAPRAADWIGNARRYVAAQRALDEVESAALLRTSNRR